MIIFDFLVVVFCLIVGFNFKNRFKIFDAYDRSVLNKLFFFHTIVSIGFFLIILNQGGDATNYWFMTYEFRYYGLNNVMEMASSGSATGNMLLLNYIPAKVLGLSFFTGNIMYGTMGFFGFVFFYAIIKANIQDITLLRNKKIFNISIFPLLLFLPNLHFWSSGVGKDTFIFFCIALFIYSLGNFKRRFIGIVFSLVLSFAVRPHITLFLITAFGIGYVLDGNLKGYQKIFIFLIFIVGFASIFSYVLQFVKLESFEVETISNYASKRSSNLGTGSGSGLDISSYPYPLKVFTFLYRPLFFDAPGILGIISSIENLFLIFFSFLILKNRPYLAFKNANFHIKGILIFFILGACSFSLILGNLGIMLRQKIPFIMSLIIFGFWTIAFNEFIKRKQIQ